MHCKGIIQNNADARMITRDKKGLFFMGQIYARIAAL